MNYIIYINQKNISDNHRKATDEFIKRLSPYCDVKLLYGVMPITSDIILKGGHKLINVSKRHSTISSTDFSDYIDKMQLSGISTVHIALNYYDMDIADASDICFSLSPASLSIDTSTVLLLEQLYRAYTIIHGKTYHK